MDNEPRVSVVIPLFNKENWVTRCITSVLGQSLQNFELIIVDDGSTDSSASIARSFPDDRIRLICKENAGAASARNVGIASAKGEYIAFLDADDEWLPDHLSVLSMALSAFPDAIAVCDEYRSAPQSFVAAMREPALPLAMGKEDAVTCYRFDCFEQLAGGHFVNSSSSTMVRTNFLRERKLRFDEVMTRGEDVNFWISLARHGDFVYCEFRGVCYHRDDVNSKMNCRSATAEAMPDFMRGISLSDLTKRQIASVNRFLGVEFVKAAYVNRGLPFRKEEMACQSLQRRGWTGIASYLVVRFSPGIFISLIKLAKKIRF